MKYSLPTGEVVDLDIDDILEIDFFTIKGKEVFQTIHCMKDSIKRYSDFDEAINHDSLKFFDKDKIELNEDIEEDFESNQETYEKASFYIEKRKQQEEED
jgi:hypothetical protein